MTTETELQQALREEAQRLWQTEIGQRLQAIQVLLNGDGAVDVLPTPTPVPQPVQDTAATVWRQVSDEHLERGRAYLEARGTAYQKDITADLQINSGITTHMMRALEAEGVAEKTGRSVRKSPEWRYIGEPTPPPPKNGGTGTRIDLGTAGHTTPGDRDAKRIAENLRYTTEEPQ